MMMMMMMTWPAKVMVEKADMADGLLLELEEERGRSGFFSFSYVLYFLVIYFVITVNVMDDAKVRPVEGMPRD